MKKRSYSFWLSLFVAFNITGQVAPIDLIFTAVDSLSHVQLDSVKIQNRVQGGDTVLHWPDTVLSLGYIVGTNRQKQSSIVFELLQNYPNPVTDYTHITLMVPERDRVVLSVMDMMGRDVYSASWTLDQGIHTFRYTPGSVGITFLNAFWRANSSSIKIIQPGPRSNQETSIKYLGNHDHKMSSKLSMGIQSFSFTPGDQLLYIGYAGGKTSGKFDHPVSSKVVAFQFASGIPCPGIPHVIHAGDTYNTVQIFSQCWLKENLNLGVRISPPIVQTNNTLVEKYCYDNSEANCQVMGGLYQWDEMMNYDTIGDNQGICPQGWHIPTDEEWNLLEGGVDDLFDFGHPVWDLEDYRGWNAGMHLKAQTLWLVGGGASIGYDIHGFSAKPGGYYANNSYSFIYGIGSWWTSSGLKYNRAMSHQLSGHTNQVFRKAKLVVEAYSVRCLRDS